MDENIEKNIQKNLVELRKANKLKQSDLAEKIGYSDKTISRWENGSTIPDVVSLCEIASFYDITLDDLVKEKAINQSTEEKKKQKKDEKVNDIVMLLLSIITIWGVATVVYVGLNIVRDNHFWQAFIWAVPISSVLVFRFNRLHDKIRWIALVSLSLVVWSIVTAVYLTSVTYNIWQLFLLPIPIEAEIVVYTMLKKDTKIHNSKK